MAAHLPGHVLQDEFQVAGQAVAFGDQRFHAHFFKKLQGGQVGGQGEHGRVAQLPGIGRGNRVELGTHQKAGLLASAPPALEPRDFGVAQVALVDKDARSVPRAAVHVFVAAPGGKIDAPVVQGQVHVPGCMGQVPAYQGPRLPPGPGNGFHVEHLPVVVIDPPEKHQGQVVSMGFDGREEVFGMPGVLPGPFGDLHQGLREIKAVVAQLALEHVLV